MTIEQHRVLHIATWVGIAVLTIVVVIFVRSWMDSRDQIAKAEVEAATYREDAKTAKEEAQAAKATAVAAQEAVDALKATLAQISAANQALAQRAVQIREQGQAQVQRVTTLPIADVATDIGRFAGPAIGTPQAPLALTDEQQRNLDMALTKGVACANDLSVLQDRFTGCEAEKAKAAELQKASEAQITAKQTQIDALENQIVSTEKERDSWKVAAKGGTWKQRAIKIVKMGAGATIGAGLGGIACHDQPPGTIFGCSAAGSLVGFFVTGIL